MRRWDEAATPVDSLKNVDGTKALVDGTLPSRHPLLRTGSRPPPCTAWNNRRVKGISRQAGGAGPVGWNRPRTRADAQRPELLDHRLMSDQAESAAVRDGRAPRA